MNRITAILLALVLLFPLALCARAGEGASLTLASVEGKVGDVVEVPLTLSDNPGITALHVRVKYDETRLQLLSVKDGGILGSEIRHQENLNTPYALAWENYLATENFTENGVLCTLSFKILDGEEGDTLPLTMVVGDYGVMDVDLKDLPRRLTDGGITVTGAALVEEKAPQPAWVTILLIAVPVLIVAAMVIGLAVFLLIRKKKKAK